MSSHDSEEFGGELYHDIIARIERSWGLWIDAVSRVPDDESQISRLTISLIDETISDDEAAVDLIRQLLEERPADPDQPVSGVDPVNAVPGSLDNAKSAMNNMHERLLGAVEAASQSSDDVLQDVRERIGGSTWMRYEARAARLAKHFRGDNS